MSKENETILLTTAESAAATKNGQTSNNDTAPLPIPAHVTFAKPFPDISKIEVFDGNNFRRWMESVYSALDMHGMEVSTTILKSMSKENETILLTTAESAAATKNGQTSNNDTAPLPIPAPVTFAKPFPDISKIEVFDGNNFRRWMESVYSALDMHGMVFALTNAKPTDDSLLNQ
ncbi:hypothetical protein COLO4_37515 [Corchorus olitorius]|uniref:Uncharacterized protein n=1 Tax=Corchorus olitorius TaxID=93759 RepID=A0A1R3G133_9ROSI|nr:hypothetical protein COLO4_37515 [Corchorus olitorius]